MTKSVIVAWHAALLPWRGDDTRMPAEHRPLALLRHEVPGHGAHFDLLLLAKPATEDEDRAALAWRTTGRIDAMAPGQRARLEAIGAHRALYLSLKGPRDLGGGRGSVEPVAAGRWAARDDGDAVLEWHPHGAPMLVRFSDERGSIDARDEVALAAATSVERR